MGVKQPFLPRVCLYICIYICMYIYIYTTTPLRYWEGDKYKTSNGLPFWPSITNIAQGWQGTPWFEISWNSFPHYWPLVKGSNHRWISKPILSVIHSFDVFIVCSRQELLNTQSSYLRFERKRHSYDVAALIAVYPFFLKTAMCVGCSRQKYLLWGNIHSLGPALWRRIINVDGTKGVDWYKVWSWQVLLLIKLHPADMSCKYFVLCTEEYQDRHLIYRGCQLCKTLEVSRDLTRFLW